MSNFSPGNYSQIIPTPPEPEPVKIVCAWCQTVLSDGTEPPSHGICPACQVKHFPDCNDAYIQL